MHFEGASSIDQVQVSLPGFSRNPGKQLRVTGLVTRQHACRSHGFGFAKPVAGVLHQEQFGHQRKSFVFGRALGRVVDGAGDAMGMDAEYFAHVKYSLRRHFFCIGNTRRPCADQRRFGVLFGKIQHKVLKLGVQHGFRAGQECPDAGLSFCAGLTQGAQVAFCQSLHVLFDLVGLQLPSEQGFALLLQFGGVHPAAKGQCG